MLKGWVELEYFSVDLAKELLDKEFLQKKGEEKISPKFPLRKDMSKSISNLIKFPGNTNPKAISKRLWTIERIW